MQVLHNMTEKIINITTYTASGFAIVLGLLNEYAAAFGVLIALATFGINAWFKYNEYLILKGKQDGSN